VTAGAGEGVLGVVLVATVFLAVGRTYRAGLVTVNGLNDVLLDDVFDAAIAPTPAQAIAIAAAETYNFFIINSRL